ncbi:MAG: hypothetical protein QGF59_32005, partial [Pirellulaceae bacterium]|nr:hypothetical protein [Pirellulaceae bacterium]
MSTPIVFPARALSSYFGEMAMAIFDGSFRYRETIRVHSQPPCWMCQFPRDQCPLANGGPNRKGGRPLPFVVPALTGSADLQPHGALSGASAWLFAPVVQLIAGS